MDSERWERIQAVFHEAVALPPAERHGYVAAAAGADTTLAEEVLAALEEDARGLTLLDGGIGRVAGPILDGARAAVEQIGPYRLVRVVGEGGMGTVFKAERVDLGTSAAIKILRDAWLSPSRRRRFSAEQRTLAALNHPGIARLFDAGVLGDGTPWIVMEYVDGVPITDYCQTHQLPLAERLRLFRAVCDAVNYAHRHLIIHRDLKPSNILVAADGSVKLLDFGIAKQLAETDSDTDVTRTGMRAMTPAYAAPEQIRGEPVGVYTDVFSLGILLYELVTGSRPYEVAADASADARSAVFDRDPPRPSGARKHTDLDVLVLTALRPDPARRYASVEALIRDLEHYRNGDALEARADAVGYRLAKFARRHWRPLTAAAATITVIIGLVAFYTIRLATARDSAVLQATRAERIQELLLGLFTGGDTSAAPADDLRVLTLLNRGVQEADAIRGEPAVQAEMHATLGTIYGRLGDFARADGLLRKALDERVRLSGAGSPEVADVELRLALLRSGQAQFDEAERFARQGLESLQKLGPSAAAAVASAYTTLGEVLTERGRYPDAIRTLEEASRLQSGSGDDNADYARTLRQLFNAHFYAGHYEVADEIGRRVLSMTRSSSGDRHALVADDLINLGAIQSERGKYQEAEAFYRDALAITEGWHGGDSPQTGSALTMLGRSIVYQKRFDEARVLLQRALGIQERVFGLDHPRVASAVNDLGNIAVQSGRLDDAEAAFTRMGDIYRKAHGGKHFLVATANSNLGGVFLAKKDYTRAESLYRGAVAMYTDTQGPDHLNTGIARIKLGRALLRQQRSADAEREILAGYDIVSRQSSPSVSWLRAAREDLVTLYTAAGRPEQAAKYRAENQPQ
ncbi:MAG TPA: serine/threonine-protein kinase [Vicinamibacterales bacterium]|nr:serine/threonine-protein kinase [Vicinamibacterales bacterium]